MLSTCSLVVIFCLHSGHVLYSVYLLRAFCVHAVYTLCACLYMLFTCYLHVTCCLHPTSTPLFARGMVGACGVPCIHGAFYVRTASWLCTMQYHGEFQCDHVQLQHALLRVLYAIRCMHASILTCEWCSLTYLMIAIHLAALSFTCVDTKYQETNDHIC